MVRYDDPIKGDNERIWYFYGSLDLQNRPSRATTADLYASHAACRIRADRPNKRRQFIMATFAAWWQGSSSSLQGSPRTTIPRRREGYRGGRSGRQGGRVDGGCGCGAGAESGMCAGHHAKIHENNNNKKFDINVNGTQEITK